MHRVIHRLTIPLILAGSAWFTNPVHSQTVSGRIADAHTGASIPFANLYISSSAGNYGTSTDVEGYYTLTWPAEAGDSVQISSVGYQTSVVPRTELLKNPNRSLTPKVEALDAFEVVGREDPAYAMIRKAVAHRTQNDPENIPRFSFRAYNKAYIDVERSDTIQAALAGTGFARAHLFFMESLTEVRYAGLGRRSEIVLSNRMSGVKNPVIGMVSNSFQPFDAYDNQLTLAGFRFLNPVSPNSDKRYRFELRDSSEVDGLKTYLIAFEPRKKRGDNLLEGSLALADHTWAIVRFHGRTANPFALVDCEIRQQSAHIGGRWFPKEMSSRFSIPLDGAEEVPVMLVSNTYIDSVDFDPVASPRPLADIVMNPGPNRPETEWKALRPVQLTAEESNTYAVYDTLPTEALNLMNWTMSQTTSLARSRLSFGKFDVLLPHLLAYNPYEGFRPGLGLATNEKLIPWLQPEVYFAYGFKDRETKYGGGLRMPLQPEREWELFLGYSSDVDEPGRSRLRTEAGFLRGGEVARNLFIRSMQRVKRFDTRMSYRPFRGMRTEWFLSREERFPRAGQAATDEGGETVSTVATEVGMALSFRPGESLIEVGRTLIPSALTYPRIDLRVSRALPAAFDGDQDFTTAEVMAAHQFKIRGLGTARVVALAGAVDGNRVDAAYLFKGRGIRGKEEWSLFAPGYFQTMDVDEFLSARYVHAGWHQNFGNVFGFETAWTDPELSLVYRAAVGSGGSDRNSYPGGMKTMTHPYLEAGVVIDNLLRMNSTFYYSGFGIGAFYRHGYYAFSDWKRNLVPVVSFAISI